jgi:hypothetical protein
MSWEEILQQHTIPPQAAPEPEPQNELDAESGAMFAAGDAEDARNHEQQALAWEKTDPDYNPHLDAEADAEMEAGA